MYLGSYNQENVSDLSNYCHNLSVCSKPQMISEEEW